MIKKIGFWLLIVLFVLGLVFGYWYLSVSKQHESAAIFNLPDSCAFIIESRDFSSLLKKLNETSLLWQELQKNKLEPESIINLKLLDSILEATDDPEAYINEKSISLVAYNEHNQFNFLLAFHTSAKGLEIWQKLLKKTGGKLEKEIAKKSLRSIFKYSPTNGSKSYYGYLNKNTIWVCEDKNLLDNCMTAEKTLQKNKDFNKVIEFAGSKNDCRIFLNLNKTHSFLQADIGNYMNSGWIELDADIKPAEFSLNGIIKSDSSSLYKELIKQEPQDIEFIQHIPEQTINFTFFGFSDYSSFYNNFYLTNNKQQNDSLSGKISRMVGNEIVLLETEIKNGKRRKYVQLRIQEIEEVKKLIRSNSLEKKSLNNIKGSDTLFYIKKPQFLSQLTAGLIAKEMQYLFFNSDYLVFCESDSSCLEYNQEIERGKTLAENENYKRLINGKVSDACNFMSYNFLPSTSTPNFLSNNILDFLSNHSELYNKLNTLSFQLSSAKENLIAQTYLLYSPTDKVNNESIWETKLDTTIISSPEFVLNHKTGMTEMIVQDVNKNLYLIGNTGKILWKKEIEDLKKSAIFQVDFYKNNKLQYLFNTATAIHLIDRNGNEVAGFPVSLNIPSTNAINVFDYEKNGDYRIIYVDTLNKIHVLRSDGKPVDGFEFAGTKKRVTQPVEWHRINSKDYLMVTDIEGNFYGLGRKGEKRLAITHSIFCANDGLSIQYGKGIDKSAIFFYDIQNKSLNKTRLNNEIEKIEIKTELENPKWFLLKKTQNDNFDLILIQNNNLEAFDNQGKLIQSLKFDNELTPSLKKITKSKSIYYSTITQNGQSILLDGNFKKISAYNFKSTQPPVCEMLNDDGFFYIITINDDLISAYSF